MPPMRGVHFKVSRIRIPLENSWNTSPKTNMTMEKSTMNEDVFPIENWDFPACHVSELRGGKFESQLGHNSKLFFLEKNWRIPFFAAKPSTFTLASLLEDQHLGPVVLGF